MVNNSCADCTKPIRTTQQVKCTNCAYYYHAICANITESRKLTEEQRQRWKCPHCESSGTTAGHSTTSSDGVSVTLQCYPDSQKLAQLPCRPDIHPITVDSSALDKIATEMKLLRESVSDMKTEMRSLTDHITQCNTRLDEYGHKIARVEDKILDLEKIATQNILLQHTVYQLKEQLNSQAQLALRNEVEIIGVNETPNESTTHIARVIAHKIGVELDEKDLDYVVRAGPRRHKHTKDTSDSSESKLPRPLVIRFLRRDKRNEFLSSGKNRRNLNCADIDVTGPNGNIFFNERLTPDNRRLFRETRQSSKSAGFKYCWVKNGLIQIRKREGIPAINITSMDDLQRHVFGAQDCTSQQTSSLIDC